MAKYTIWHFCQARCGTRVFSDAPFCADCSCGSCGHAVDDHDMGGCSFRSGLNRQDNNWAVVCRCDLDEVSAQEARA